MGGRDFIFISGHTVGSVKDDTFTSLSFFSRICTFMALLIPAYVMGQDLPSAPGPPSQCLRMR